MSNENAVLDINKSDGILEFDFDEFEENLQNELESQLLELEFLEKEKEKISNPDSLGETMMNAVWDQFMNQMAIVAGEEFISENKGMTLDLSKDAHIQTAENFAKGKVASHNKDVDYQQRYDNWQSKFKKDENGNIKLQNDNRTNTQKSVLADGVRESMDKGRPKGTQTTHKDHVISIAENVRDPRMNAFVDEEAQRNFINSEANIQDLDASANMSKGDSSTREFLESERNGQKPEDRFDINKKEMLENDDKAREQKENLVKSKEEEAYKSGKKSQRDEALKITGKALKTMVMQLLAELLKEIFKKLILWLKSAKKSIDSLIDSFKIAIKSFVDKLGKHIINAGSSVISTIITSIVGPSINIIKKIVPMIKQSFKSIKEAIDYIKKPENKNKSLDILLLEVGKIVIAGLSVISAAGLASAIEGSLISTPLNITIPLLGNLSGIIGIFMGGVISGVIGAIVINMIDKFISKRQQQSLVEKQINQSNEVLNKQNKINKFKEENLIYIKNEINSNVATRHQQAQEYIKNTLDNIFDEDMLNEIDGSGNENIFENMNNLLDELSF